MIRGSVYLAKEINALVFSDVSIDCEWQYKWGAIKTYFEQCIASLFGLPFKKKERNYMFIVDFLNIKTGNENREDNKKDNDYVESYKSSDNTSDTV